MIMISPGFLDKNEISKCSHLREHRDALKVSLYSEHFLISDCHEQGNLENQPPLGYSSLWLTRVLRGLSSLVSEHLSFPSTPQSFKFWSLLTVSCWDPPQMRPSLMVRCMSVTQVPTPTLSDLFEGKQCCLSSFHIFINRSVKVLWGQL